MLRVLLPLLAALAASAAGPVYELSGRLVPRSGAFVSLYGSTVPFSANTLADVDGRFHFKKLEPGMYTVSIFSRRRGEARRTVEVGPSTADPRGRVSLTLQLKDSDFVFSNALRRHVVSARQLAIPEAAWREYRDAQKDLSKYNVDSAVKRLEHAVDLAPQFSAAWNNLGTIAYQTRKYDRAEECFRMAVEQDPQSYEALVNLGGVLVTLRKLDEAMDYNLKAVLTRPNDALANAQLGITYFSVGQFDLAVKYLERTRQIDPANFSYPQLLLFQIYSRRGQKDDAAGALEDFLARHPDWPQAAKLRETINVLRAASH
jgi:tetratricopeptide (TPR) repeat protein